jgi:hypothetical protein
MLIAKLIWYFFSFWISIKFAKIDREKLDNCFEMFHMELIHLNEISWVLNLFLNRIIDQFALIMKSLLWFYDDKRKLFKNSKMQKSFIFNNFTFRSVHFVLQKQTLTVRIPYGFTNHWFWFTFKHFHI